MAGYGQHPLGPAHAAAPRLADFIGAEAGRAALREAAREAAAAAEAPSPRRPPTRAPAADPAADAEPLSAMARFTRDNPAWAWYFTTLEEMRRARARDERGRARAPQKGRGAEAPRAVEAKKEKKPSASPAALRRQRVACSAGAGRSPVDPRKEMTSRRSMGEARWKGMRAPGTKTPGSVSHLSSVSFDQIRFADLSAGL